MAKISAEYLDALKTETERKRDAFLEELARNEAWTPCKGNDHASLFYKIDKASPIKKFRISARLACHLQTVLDALLVPENRVSWEILVDSMRDIETFGDGCSMHYITTRPVAAGLVSGRDFVHFRRIFDIPTKAPIETQAKIVIDISCTHPDFPETKKFVRGTTLFCATVFREFHANGRYEVSYESITQSDIHGWIPSFFVNAASKSSTLEWFEHLEKKIAELEPAHNNSAV